MIARPLRYYVRRAQLGTNSWNVYDREHPIARNSTGHACVVVQVTHPQAVARANALNKMHEKRMAFRARGFRGLT